MLVKKLQKALSHKQTCESIESVIALIKPEASRLTTSSDAETCVNKIVKPLNLCRQVENAIPKVASVEILNSLMNLKESKDSSSRALKLFHPLWRFN